MENLINFERYHHWLDEGRSFSDVRTDLEKRGLTEPEIRHIIRRLDNEQIAKYNQKYSKKPNPRLKADPARLFVYGVVLSLALSLFSYWTLGSIELWAFIPLGIGSAAYSQSKFSRSPHNRGTFNG